MSAVAAATVAARCKSAAAGNIAAEELLQQPQLLLVAVMLRSELAGSLLEKGCLGRQQQGLTAECRLWGTSRVMMAAGPLVELAEILQLL